MKATNLVIYSVFLHSVACERCIIGSAGCCDTMIPPSLLPPNDSTCWKWWTPPASGVVNQDMEMPPKGCDYQPCQDAVCACDSYCCESAWDLSCRGYTMNAGDAVENNYFVDQCSARNLCCEPETASPKPEAVNSGSEVANSTPEVISVVDTSFECTPGSPDCCETMIPPSYFPPNDSTCWQWFTPPANGIPTDNIADPQKGCNYQPCQDAVCACDPYCCNAAWDLSCRGYEIQPGDGVENNYFVNGCSAKVLCCDQK